MSNDFKKFLCFAVVVVIFLIITNLAVDSFWNLNDASNQYPR